MFKNVGEKLQVVAMALFMVSMLLGVLILIFSLCSFVDNIEYIGYAEHYGGSSDIELTRLGNMAYEGIVGVCYSLTTILLGFIVPWFIYGFGVIVSKYENLTGAAPVKKK